jgi:hypothetical protein
MRVVMQLLWLVVAVLGVQLLLMETEFPYPALVQGFLLCSLGLAALCFAVLFILFLLGERNETWC